MFIDSDNTNIIVIVESLYQFTKDTKQLITYTEQQTLRSDILWKKKMIYSKMEQKEVPQ